MNQWFGTLWGVLLSLIVSTAPVFAAPQAINHTYPKLANYYLSWEIPTADIATLAKWDVVILDMEVQHRQPEVLRQLRQTNPDIILIAYITSQEIIRTVDERSSVMRSRLAARITPDMYLLDSRGARLSWWPGTYLLNVTDRSSWVDTLLTFVDDTIMSTGYWDGIFYDNMWDNITYFVGTDVDIDRDGRVDADANTAWKQGMERLYAETAKRFPDAIILANGTSGAYNGLLHGKMLENMSGGTAWQPTMLRYLSNDTAAKRPSVQIINANTANRGNALAYQTMRFGLTSSLLGNGYYSFDYGDQNHGQVWWYDEYDIDLGSAIQSATSPTGASGFAPGVWRRDFDRGVSLVNSDTRPLTVSLGGEFEALTGRQDPLANNGAIVSQVTLPAQDGRILLKTTETLEDVIFTNGDFVRFFRADGTRVRNGYFVFDDSERGGTQIGRIDMNGNGMAETILVTGPKIEIYRDDGVLYMKAYPYTANYTGTIRIAVGDLDNNGYAEVFVAPGPGHTLPIKVYARHGTQIKQDWYPFGAGYSGGYSLAVGALSGPFRSNLVIGAGVGSRPYVNIFDWQYDKVDDWFAYETTFTGGVFVATGDIDGDGADEIITGPGAGKGPVIRTFEADGTVIDEFTAYTTFLTEGIDVRSTDVDFDGVDDIIGLSSGVGL